MKKIKINTAIANFSTLQLVILFEHTD
jgi:hypothetical protein